MDSVPSSGTRIASSNGRLNTIPSTESGTIPMSVAVYTVLTVRCTASISLAP